MQKFKFGEDKISVAEILMELTFAERCLLRRGDPTAMEIIEAMTQELCRRIGVEAANDDYNF
jgi:hypothetical protein